ncbi:hypothetical protein JQ615_40945, partial [Bradyrhizobium jicamae]|nr:hypothetical protein [Bradyrhizobium jicamae]
RCPRFSETAVRQLAKPLSRFCEIRILTGLAAKGLVGPGLTEHGLRATFAAKIKRVTGANDDQVAAALGDRDVRMGAHYTRHVENRTRIGKPEGLRFSKTTKSTMILKT